NPSGVRLGSPAVTTRGFREPEMHEVGLLISAVLGNITSEETIASVGRRVLALTEKFPLYGWKLAPAAATRCMLSIAIDARRVRDFGVGTYIRNLFQSLAKLDHENLYTLVVR